MHCIHVNIQAADDCLGERAPTLHTQRQRRGACHICQMLVPQRAPRAHPSHTAADRLRRSDSPVVAHVVRGVGEHLSPELGVPKIMWFNETYGAAWMERVGLALELLDFLTYKCTNALERSITLFHISFSTSRLQRDQVGTWVSIKRSDLKRCSRTTLLALELVHSIRATRSERVWLPRPPASWAGAQDGVATSLIDAAGWLGSILCHDGDQTQRPAEGRASGWRAMGARVALSAAPASDRCDRRLGAASCRECGTRSPRQSSVPCMFTCMQCM